MVGHDYFVLFLFLVGGRGEREGMGLVKVMFDRISSCSVCACTI